MHASRAALVLGLVQQCISATLRADTLYNLTFLHVNDIHARLDQFQPIGTDCDSKHECIGGYARLKGKIDELRRKYPNSLLLDAGDEWQGTLFFSYYDDGRKIAETLNAVGINAMTLGNHEFDEGDDRLAAYLESLKFPVLSANLHTTSPKLSAANILPFALFEKHELAVIGLTTPDTPRVSSPSRNTTFSSPAAALTNQVKAIKAAHPNIKRFRRHVIIGGHSHTLIGGMSNAKGKYPTIVKNAAGKDVLVVTSFRFGEYLGRLTVLFDKNGEVSKWDGEPIRITADIHPDKALAAKIAEWRKPFALQAQEVVGNAKVDLSSVCQHQECSMGNLVCDVMVAFRNSGPETAHVHGGFYNSGGVRTSLSEGAVRRGDVMNAFPFKNAIVGINLRGQELWDVFEGMFNGVNADKHKINSYLQVSSDFEVKFDSTAPVGSRLLSLKLGGTPVDLRKTYTIATNDFIAAGGDFFFPPKPRDASVPSGPNMAAIDELVIRYLKRHNPYVPPAVGQRLRNVSQRDASPKPDPSSTPDSSSSSSSSKPNNGDPMDGHPSIWGDGDVGGKPGTHVAVAHPGTVGGFPVEDGAWTALAILAACITLIILGLEYIGRNLIY
ncbi:Metallo-dependent phosphatase-like protein [Auriculariales sp. MPI-PUGE-AT-0066]|nr:Metallo-dependent phosphatase-like protein [Auriculariales sp. MPI-PUGE-AT-0066]